MSVGVLLNSALSDSSFYTLACKLMVFYVCLQVDEIFINSLKDAGLYDSIWQAFAVFLPVKTVGVQGDRRSHSNAVALRAITSEDGMTADWYTYRHTYIHTYIHINMSI